MRGKRCLMAVVSWQQIIRATQLNSLLARLRTLIAT
jgi:hypothetical protein